MRHIVVTKKSCYITDSTTIILREFCAFIRSQDKRKRKKLLSSLQSFQGSVERDRRKLICGDHERYFHVCQNTFQTRDVKLLLIEVNKPVKTACLSTEVFFHLGLVKFL